MPGRLDCPACSRPVLIAESRARDGVLLAYDPDPDGDGEHFDTILSADLSRVDGSGDAIAGHCKGRFRLYRHHFWTCPQRLGVPPGTVPPPVGGYWQRPAA